jgi:hypothetical protein
MLTISSVCRGHLVLPIAGVLIVAGVACSARGTAPQHASSGPPRATVATATETAAPTTPARQLNHAVNPGTLLSRDDAAALLGEPVDEGQLKQAGPPLGRVLCTYGASAQTSAEAVQLCVVRTQTMSDQLRHSGYSARKLFEDGKALQPVFGVGDEASRFGREIAVVRGDTEFNLSIGLPTALASGMEAAALTATAGDVAARLPQ